MMPTERPPTFSASQLAEALEDLARGRHADYRDDLVGRVRATTQRPAWTIRERWLPMALITARSATAPPLRSAWILLLTGLVIAALVASLVIVGSVLLRDQRPDGLHADLLVPTLELEQTWDPNAVPGLSQPSGLDVGPDGNVYVVNAGTDEVLVLDPDGHVIRRWGEQGTGDGEFIFQGDPTDPTATFGGVTVSPDGSWVYVTDDANDRVQQFDGMGTFVQAWGRYGTEDGQFLAPFDLSAGPDGSVYVVDSSRSDIQRFDGQGVYLETIDHAGPGDPPLTTNGGLAVDLDGNVFNVDYDLGLLRSWSLDGSYRWSSGDSAGASAQLELPGDVATDADGNIYVTEPDGITVFAPDGSLVSTWDVPATDKEEEWLPIAIGADGSVYLSARYENVIHKLRTVEGEPLIAERPAPASSSVPLIASARSSIAPDASLVTTPVVSTAFGDRFTMPFSVDLPPGWRRFRRDDRQGGGREGQAGGLPVRPRSWSPSTCRRGPSRIHVIPLPVRRRPSATASMP